jgi:hypothetical protein
MPVGLVAADAERGDRGGLLLYLETTAKLFGIFHAIEVIE